MWIPPKNPKIEELTKSCTDRRINLSDLEPIIVDGIKCCRWCTKILTGRKYMWCSTECQTMAWAWANPQKEGGLHIILARQDFKCNQCQFDYMPYIQDSIKYMNRNKKKIDPDSIRTTINETLMKIFKCKVPSDYSPNVDHVIAICNGGTSLGFLNHQILCLTCHRNKTKIDLSSKRKGK